MLTVLRADTATSVLLQVEWSPDDAHAYVVCSDDAVRIFNVATGGLTYTLRGHRGRVFTCRPISATTAAAAPPHLLLTCSHDGTLAVWDAARGRHVRTLDLVHSHPGAGRWAGGYPLAVLEVAWHPDGRTLFATDCAGQVRPRVPSRALLFCEVQCIWRCLWLLSMTCAGCSSCT